MMDPTSLMAGASAGAVVAGYAAWGLTRRWYGTRLEQQQVRYTQLHEAAVQFEKETRHQLVSLRAELVVQRARAQSASDMREQQARKAMLEAVLAEEASKPRTDDTVFPDTEPQTPWADTRATAR